MPWAHISTGVTTRYLALERKRAAAETTTLDCTFEKCTGCGACQALDCDNMLAGVRSTPKRACRRGWRGHGGCGVCSVCAGC